MCSRSCLKGPREQLAQRRKRHLHGRRRRRNRFIAAGGHDTIGNFTQASDGVAREGMTGKPDAIVTIPPVYRDTDVQMVCRHTFGGEPGADASGCRHHAEWRPPNELRMGALVRSRRCDRIVEVGPTQSSSTPGTPSGRTPECASWTTAADNGPVAGRATAAAARTRPSGQSALVSSANRPLSAILPVAASLRK